MPGRLQLCDVWKIRRAQFSVLVAIAAVAFLGLKSAAADEPKRVLLVHSFGSAAPPFTVESTAFETELVGMFLSLPGSERRDSPESRR